MAVRNWGPSQRVYITAEMGDTSGGGTTETELYRYLCYGGASCTPSLYSVGVWPKAVGSAVTGSVTALHTAMAIQVDGNNVEDVDIIRRAKVDTDCDDDSNTTEAAEAALDLNNYNYHTDTSTVTSGKLVSTNIGNSTNNACTDSGVSQLKNGAALNACYTFKVDPLSSGLDRLRCNDEGGGPTYVWWNPVDLTSTVVEDHPAFDFKDGDRVVAGSRRPTGTGNDEIRFHFPDAGGSPEPNFGIALTSDVTGGIYPDMVSASVSGGGEVLYAVWEADDRKEIRIGRCPATEDCQSSGDWTVTTAHSTVDGRLFYPELVLDGAFQMLVWQEDDDETDGNERIYAMTRCGGTGTWGAPELIRTPDVNTDDQSIWIANPHVVLNRNDNVANVLLIEFGSSATSELWWARKDYSDCP